MNFGEKVSAVSRGFFVPFMGLFRLGYRKTTALECVDWCADGSNRGCWTTVPGGIRHANFLKYSCGFFEGGICSGNSFVLLLRAIDSSRGLRTVANSKADSGSEKRFGLRFLWQLLDGELERNGVGRSSCGIGRSDRYGLDAGRSAGIGRPGRAGRRGAARGEGE